MATSDSSPRKIWIDTDIIFNKPGQEVDDGLALMMALNNRNVEIKGISLIHNVDNGYRVTKKLLDFYARYPIPVYKGTDDARRGAGKKTQAVEELAGALEKDDLSVIAIGPATNIANLIEFYPDAAQNINDLVFCAGRQKGAVFTTRGSTTHFPDYNFEMDPQSMMDVIKSDIPVTLSGYEASSSIFLKQEDLEKIRKNGRKGDRWVYRQLQPWMDRWKNELNINGFIPFDTSTSGHVLYPGSRYFHYYRDIPVAMNVRENDSQNFYGGDKKPYLEVSHDFKTQDTVDFVYKTAPEYKQVVMENLLGK